MLVLSLPDVSSFVSPFSVRCVLLWWKCNALLLLRFFVLSRWSLTLFFSLFDCLSLCFLSLVCVVWVSLSLPFFGRDGSSFQIQHITYRKKQNYIPEFSVAESIIDLLYFQTLIWISLAFFPLGSVLSSACLFVNFKWEKARSFVFFFCFGLAGWIGFFLIGTICVFLLFFLFLDGWLLVISIYILIYCSFFYLFSSTVQADASENEAYKGVGAA